MEYLILILVAGMVYLRWQMNREFSKDDQFDKIKSALDHALDESPYKLEPIIVKKRTRKKTGRVRQPKKEVPKKKVVKKKTKRKTKRKVK